MTWFFIFLLAVLLGGSVWVNVIVLKDNLKLNDQREELVDTIEESLDVLEAVYARISHAAELPVLSDEPVIRDLLSDIRGAKHAVLAIANNVVTYGDDGEKKGE